MDCLFCEIVNKTLPSKKIFEDENFYAFEDINPVKPIHVLIVPKKHISAVSKITEENKEGIQDILFHVKKVAQIMNIEKSGFRIIINDGENGGQTVDHLHLHLLAGEKMSWPNV